MAEFGISYIIKLIYSILTIILIAFVYTYIDSLEKKGCACAVSPNVNFIKGFSLFAMVYLVFTGLISDKLLYDTFGSNLVLLYKYVDLIFVLVFVYYLYVVFQYTRYLVNEKCKCSVDMRREIIMIGSFIEFALIFILFLLNIIIFTIFVVIYNVIKNVNDNSDNVRDVIRDPIGSLSKVPKSLSKEASDIKNYVKKTTNEVKRVGTRRSSATSPLSRRR
jgi:hypothetical protein